MDTEIQTSALEMMDPSYDDPLLPRYDVLEWAKPAVDTVDMQKLSCPSQVRSATGVSTQTWPKLRCTTLTRTLRNSGMQPKACLNFHCPNSRDR